MVVVFVVYVLVLLCCCVVSVCSALTVLVELFLVGCQL